MGYPKDLDEYSEDQLKGELERRAGLRAKGLCDYCGRPPSEPACRFQGRHHAAIAPRKCQACGSGLLGSPPACYNIVCREQGKAVQ
ncbi:MAG: hypothetical protein AB7W59_00310 [Acidimicrobiia bacterium]